MLKAKLLKVVQRPSVPLRRIEKPLSSLLTSDQFKVAAALTWLIVPAKLAGVAGALGKVIAATLLVLSRVRNILKYTGDLSVILVAPTIARNASTPAFKSKSTLLIMIGRRGDTLMLVLLCLTIVASKLMLFIAPCSIKLPDNVCTCIEPSASESRALKSSVVVKCKLGKKPDSNNILCIRELRTSLAVERLVNGIDRVAIPVVETVPFNCVKVKFSAVFVFLIDTK